jgi:regulator of sirC expression with transglutaminase-like and TPR domain
MPIHFICQYHSPLDSFYIDPFNKGQILTAAECMKLLHRARHPFHESYLAPARPRDIIARMIRNLIFIYHYRNDQAKVEALGHLLKILVS